jgi:hypothetical protein
VDAVFFFFTRNVIPPSVIQRSINQSSILVRASVSSGAGDIGLCRELFIETSRLVSLLCLLAANAFKS